MEAKEAMEVLDIIKAVGTETKEVMEDKVAMEAKEDTEAKVAMEEVMEIKVVKEVTEVLKITTIDMVIKKIIHTGITMHKVVVIAVA